jgi:hypothetical protein
VAHHPAEQAIRDQEVLRATRELAAYFKGGRTEREARAALKIIKAFVRDRERQDPKSRPPLPGLKAAAAPAAAVRAASTRAKSKRKFPRRARRTVSLRETRLIDPEPAEERPDRSGSDERQD